MDEMSRLSTHGHEGSSERVEGAITYDGRGSRYSISREQRDCRTTVKTRIRIGLGRKDRVVL